MQRRDQAFELRHPRQQRRDLGVFGGQQRHDVVVRFPAGHHDQNIVDHRWRSPPTRRRPVTQAEQLPHAGKEVHIVLDNLSTHTTPDVQAWLEKNPNVQFHFTPVGSSWINQIETWFGIITRQAIRRGTFSSVRVLIKRIQDYITHWNSNAEPFVWTATADEILAKVRLVQSNIKKLLDNNAK